MGTCHRWVTVAVMVLVCMVASSMASAQEQPGESVRKNSLEKGKSALMFQILGDINLRQYDGANLSYKRMTADNRAYRLGVTLDLRTQSGENSQPSTGKQKTKLNSQSIDLTLLKLFVPHSTGRVGFYYGVGPLFGFDRNFNESRPPVSFSYKNRSLMWSAGIDCVIGLEWFASHELSLVGEYGTAVTYSHSNSSSWTRLSTDGWELVSESKSDNWQLSPSTVRLGVAVYW